MFKTACITSVVAFLVMMTFYLLLKPRATFRSDLTPTSPMGVKPAQYPDANDLRQNDWGGSNQSAYIDEAIKKTLRDPDSYRFISATRWAQDGSKAWVCKATYRTENGFGEYAIPEGTDVIFDANGCRVLNPALDKNTSTMTAAERREMNRQIKQVHELVKGSKPGER
jgi:hypothetical protein